MTTAPRFRTILAAAVAGTVLATAALAQEVRVKLPVNYNDFTNYLSLDRTGNDEQIIRLFANDVALQGAGDDGQLAYGSVLVGELWAAKKDEAGEVIESSLGQRIPAKLAAIVVMERQPGWNEGIEPDMQNADWDFAVYNPDGSVKSTDVSACRGCHAPLGDQGHLFSFDHLR